MTHEQASKLIERYFAGETSLAEEQQLKTYFAAGNVRPELLPYAPLFEFWKCESEVEAPTPATTVKTAKPQTKIRRLPHALLAIAAAMLLLIVVNYPDSYRGQHTPELTDFPVAERQPVDWSRHEITDQKEALRFLKTTFKTAGEKLKAGPIITIHELRTALD